MSRASVSGRVSILDVGIGTGQSILKICDYLGEKGITASVTGVDVFLPPSSIRAEDPRIQMVQGDFDSEPIPGLFDVVNATQSLYYFPSPADTLTKMLRMARPGGLLTTTVWQSGCILRRTNQELFADSAEPVDDLGVLAILARLIPDQRIHVEAFEGEFSCDAMLDDEQLLRAFLHIVSRKNEFRDYDVTTLAHAKAFLQSVGAGAKRKNAVIWAPVTKPL
jgi:SAM-dependent methyltransferase